MAEFFQSGLGGASSSFASSTSITNLGLAASVAANAMTIALKDASGADATVISPVTIQFRNSTQATGTPTQVLVTGALSTVISSGSTGGSVSAAMSRMYIYLLNNAGTAELAWAGSNIFDENAVVSTTAEGGAGAADSPSTMYSTTARTNVAFRYIGFIESTQSTAGTWATSPSRIGIFTDCYPKAFAEIQWDTTNGFGSTNIKIRKYTNNGISTDANGLLTVANDATNGFSVTANRRCRINIVCVEQANQNMPFGISKNSTQLTTAVQSCTRSTILTNIPTTGEANTTAPVTLNTIIQASDVLRPHSEGDATGTQNNYGGIYIFAEEL